MAIPLIHQRGESVSTPSTEAPYKPAQRGRDIGQKKSGDQISKKNAQAPCHQREQQQLDSQKGDQSGGCDTKGAERAEHRSSLFKRQSHRTIHDE